MKQLHHIIYTALCIGLLSACEHELPYRVNDQEPKLVMNAMLDAGQEENLVHLCISEMHTTYPVNQGTVTLYINGKLAETAEDTTYSNRVKSYRLRSRLTPGDHIRLEATAENERYHAWSEVTVPQPLKGIQVDTFPAPIKQYGNNYGPATRFQVTMQDPAGENNYYRLSIAFVGRAPYTDGEGHEYMRPVRQEAELINNEDVILTDGRPSSTNPDENDVMGNYIENLYNLFTDQRFPGGSHSLRVYLPHTGNNRYLKERINASGISVRLYSLTQTGYRYLSMLNTLEDDDYDSQLMEPAILPNNVTGGLGLVDVCASAEVLISLSGKE